MKAKVIALGNYGKITLPQILGLNHWFVITGFVIIVLAAFVFFEKKNL